MQTRRLAPAQVLVHWPQPLASSLEQAQELAPAQPAAQPAAQLARLKRWAQGRVLEQRGLPEELGLALARWCWSPGTLRERAKEQSPVKQEMAPRRAPVLAPAGQLLEAQPLAARQAQERGPPRQLPVALLQAEPQGSVREPLGRQPAAPWVQGQATAP